ncbi:GyrI-like domain-containing protein [Listeria costaricensis]|uniref:GyrI-like domain-containing protein n=1 Tax=Listeria costaricensis TaxID=2026604 RepID=UPI000C08A967|nr:GyrI-like domain-containing protein [Listeria costaricensis]
MKYEWRKQEKNLYLPSQQPVFLEVPTLKYLTIKGEGDPNGEAFTEKTGALYALSYAIRMMPKKGLTPPGYFEYTVYPLEGEWSTKQRDEKPLDKSQFTYTIMIRQPDFVTSAVFEEAKRLAAKKVEPALLEAVKLEERTEGAVIQILHVGSYDSEPASFEKMADFAEREGYVRLSKDHKEIYLSDPRKTALDKLKTVLRVQVKESFASAE